MKGEKPAAKRVPATDKMSIRQERLRLKLQEKAELDKKKSAELQRKRNQALGFVSVLQEDIMNGGTPAILDAIDSLYQILEWERDFMTTLVEPKIRIKQHLSLCFPNYQKALKMAMDQKLAKEQEPQK